MRIGWIAALVVASVAWPARADVVWTERCPWGARERTSHSGPRCEPWSCESDAQCDQGLVCRPWRVCTQTHEVMPGGRGAYRDPPPPPTREEQVVQSCDPSLECTGEELPRAPTAGRAVGAVQCRVMRACVRPDLPSLPRDLSTIDPGVGSAPPPPATSAEPPPQNPPSAPPARGCACRVQDRSHDGASLIALVIVLAALVVRRRSR
ncbi:MYXO-CTERM sorting domain-containing protein [Sandaracinus amylolyticus]|nr:MYXO-CTERM sorting domain-containing protein [Sandaracinus amylolyticus]